MKYEKVCCHCAAGIIRCENKKYGKVLCANGHVIPRAALISAPKGDKLLPSYLKRFIRVRKTI